MYLYSCHTIPCSSKLTFCTLNNFKVFIFKDICAEFEALDSAIVENEHFEKDLPEKMQSVLGKYICTHIRDQERENKLRKIRQETNQFTWTDQDENDQKEFGVFGEEIFDELRKKLGINFKQLAV